MEIYDRKKYIAAKLIKERFSKIWYLENVIASTEHLQQKEVILKRLV